MNKYANTPQDIHKRIYIFVISCYANVIKKIPKNVESIPIISQITSSLTSIGANDQEADATITKKDFVSKYSIARKEAKETVYWLSIIKDLNLVSKSQVEPYIQECREITLIISKIINNTRN